MADTKAALLGTDSSSGSSREASVRFRFRNIGPVNDAELELGDLTIIAGRNNTGKTYLVYTLYGFLKLSRQPQGFFFEPGDDATPHYIKLYGMAKELARTGRVSHPLSRDEFLQERREVIQELAKNFSESSFSKVFSQSGAFEEAVIEVQVSDRFPEQQGGREISRGPNSGMLLHYDGQSVVASMDNSSVRPDSVGHIHSIASEISGLYLDLLFPDIPSAPFVLSAERFGISLFYKELDFARNNLVDMLQKMGDEKDRDAFSSFVLLDKASSRYALPIRDNINFTRSIPGLREKSAAYEERLSDNIVDMMDGRYESAEDDIRFVSGDREDRKFDIPLYVASSSVRGLSDLYFFSQHSVEEGQLLIIDEPESHLDTTNQMRMARLLARLVRGGIKILVTTHSDYLIKELNNLIMLSNSFENRNSVIRDLGYEADDFLEPSSVRAYVAEENGLTRCDVDEFGIDMPVFDRSIDQINHISNELVSRLESNA